MTNQQLYLAIGLPCFTIIVSLIISIIQISGIRSEISGIHADIRDIRTEIAALRDMLVGKLIEHGERIARLEK